MLQCENENWLQILHIAVICLGISDLSYEGLSFLDYEYCSENLIIICRNNSPLQLIVLLNNRTQTTVLCVWLLI
jgi:hypothetical protein